MVEPIEGGTLSYEDILYEVGGGRATITPNRPDRLNAFRVQTIAELCEAFEAAADDEAVGVIVFTGAGDRAFCVGGDVREPTLTAAEKRHLHHLHDRLALAMGLVNAVVEPGELDGEVDRWCTEILRRSPQGLRLAKLALNAATDQLYSAVQHGLELVALNHVWGPEPKEGIASFQEKRPADWRKFRDGQGPEPAAG